MKANILSESKKTPARISSRISGTSTPNYLSSKQTPIINNIGSFKKFKQWAEEKNAVVKSK